ncbi:hypothetical protein ACVWZZ_002593 [Bradyrhizobium sp. LM6.10]
MPLRRQFDLLPIDREFLDEYGLPWETIVDGSQWVLIHDFPVPRGYNHATVTAAIRIETGYPNTELNMVYFFPALARADGKAIGATEAQQQLDGKTLPALVPPPHGREPVEDRARSHRDTCHSDRGLA